MPSDLTGLMMMGVFIPGKTHTRSPSSVSFGRDAEVSLR